jgi:hypothetical protein
MNSPFGCHGTGRLALNQLISKAKFSAAFPLRPTPRSSLEFRDRMATDRAIIWV